MHRLFSRLGVALPMLLLANFAICQETASSEVVRTGEMRLTYTLTEVVGAEAAASLESVLSPDEPITWQLYVPVGYQPEKPAGLMVYISPRPSGRIPRGWDKVMDDQNMIWIGANGAGNDVKVVARAVFAMVARTVASSKYSIDPERVYLSGFSGGAKVAGIVAADHPQWFKGAIYMAGARFWDDRTPKLLELVKHNHYVFLVGSMDQARQPTRKVYKQYLSSGVDNSKLMLINNLGHRRPNVRYFNEAIQYLDSRLDKDT
jgi:poly(3-hydroxybutyrate) depolymerase